MGTYGSRSASVGGSAIARATDKIIAKAKKFAAHRLEASEADIELKDGRFSVAGTDRSLAWAEVTLAAYVPHDYPADELEPGLEETAFYDPSNFVYPAGAYGCEVEVDPETGAVSVIGFWAADDFGVVINPLIVAGQQHGGVVQGLGQALLENTVYDENGQLLTGSFMDYALPRSDNMPNIVVDHSCVTRLHAQPARREGLRRGGRDRRAAGPGQCRDRRAAGRRSRHRAHRHAADPVAGLGGDASRTRRGGMIGESRGGSQCMPLNS